MKSFWSILFPSVATGFGSAGISRQRECGALLVVGGGGWENAQRGVETDEIGMNIRRFECRYYLAVNEKLQNNAGEPRARSMSDDWSRDITIEGEMIGPVPYSIATACEVANDTDILGTGAGDIFIDELADNQERGGWRSWTGRFSSDPLIYAT